MKHAIFYALVAVALGSHVDAQAPNFPSALIDDAVNTIGGDAARTFVDVLEEGETPTVVAATSSEDALGDIVVSFLARSYTFSGGSWQLVASVEGGSLLTLTDLDTWSETRFFDLANPGSAPLLLREDSTVALIPSEWLEIRHAFAGSEVRPIDRLPITQSLRSRSTSSVAASRGSLSATAATPEGAITELRGVALVEEEDISFIDCVDDCFGELGTPIAWTELLCVTIGLGACGGAAAASGGIAFAPCMGLVLSGCGVAGLGGSLAALSACVIKCF